LGQKHALPRCSIAVRFTSINGHQHQWRCACGSPNDHVANYMQLHLVTAGAIFRISIRYFIRATISRCTSLSILNKSFKIGAEVTIPAAGAEGVLVTQGGRFNGWGLYLLAGKPVFHYDTVGVYRYTVAGPDRLSPGSHTILVDFKYDGGGLGKGGTATLIVDGRQVTQGRIERTIPFRISADETLDIGEDTGTPVSEDYQVPFKFSGDVKKVAIQLTDAALSAEDEAEIRRIRAEIGLSE
jgi:hypothetical protein